MQITIKEPLRYFLEDGVTEVFYPIIEITLFKNRNKIKVTMINVDQFNIFHERLNRANRLALMDCDHKQLLFKVTYDKNNNFYFRKNNSDALEFLKTCRVISDKLYEDALAQINNPLLFPINNNQLQKTLAIIREEPEGIITERRVVVEEKEAYSEDIQLKYKSPVRGFSGFFSNSTNVVSQLSATVLESSPKPS